jgi:hypothetical protein
MSRATLSKTSYTTAFNPTSIASCALWLDAADSASFTFSSGSNINQWTDKSGSGNNATGGVSPTYNSSARSVIFNGTSSYLQTPLSAVPTVETVFAVFTVTMAPIYNRFNDILGTSAFYGRGFNVITSLTPTSTEYQLRYDSWGTGSIALNSYGSVIYNTLTLATGQYTGGQGAGSTYGSNFGSFQSLSFSGAGTTRIGAGNNGDYFTGTINEVIIYNSVLTATQRQQIEGYLAWKWGLQAQLPSFANIPKFIPGCQLWLDGADTSSMTMSGSIVTQWNDKSGKGLNVTNTVSAAGPTFSSTAFNSSKPGLFFNGSSTYLSTAPLSAGVTELSANGTDSTLFVVFHASTGQTHTVIYSLPTTRDTYVLRYPWDGAGTRLLIHDMADRVLYTGSTNVYGPKFVSAWRTGSSHYVAESGTITGSNIGTASNSLAALPAQRFNIGFGEDARYFTGAISEFIIYNTAITNAQIYQIEGYLAWKWGIQSQLPNTHSYYLAAPTAHSYSATTPIGTNLRPALSAALAPTPVRALSKAPYNATFTPTSIAGCAMWYDGADPAGTGVAPAPGTTVTTWIDKSGNANHGTSGTATFQTDSLGGYINFTGSQSYTITNPNIVVNQYFTIFVVEQLQNFSPSGGGGGHYAFMGGSTGLTNQNLHLRYGGSSTGGDATASSGRFGFCNNDLTFSSNVSAFTTNVAQPNRVWTFSFTASSRIVYLFSVNAGSDANNTQLSAWTGAAIGTAFGGQYYNGKMREVMIYSGTLTTTQRQQIEGYLAAKWGIQSSLPTFSPTSISGCRLWLDGADATTLSLSGTIVTQWRDKSGNANNTTTIGGSPTYTSNFINLNGSTTYLVGPYVNTTQFLTMFVVVTANFSQGDYNSYYRLLSIGSTGANDYENDAYASILHAGGTNQLGGYRNRQTNFATVTTNTLFIIAVVYDGTNSTNYINGTSASVVSSTGTFGTSSYSIGRDVGNSFGAYTYWPGTVGEVIIYNASLTATQRQQVEGYLAWKWGLQSQLLNTHLQYTAAPAGHPYVTTAPTGASLRPALSAALVPAGVRGVAAVRKLQLQTFTYTGADQTFVVPAATNSLTVYMWAGGGGGGYAGTGTLYGGAGAYVQGVLSVTPFSTLNIIVGGGGAIANYPASSYTYGGGGTGGGYCGSGGGRSAIRVSGATDDLVTVGAGGGSAYWSYNNSYGGNGDSVTGSGANGGTSGSYYGGLGGTQSAGGAVGYGDYGYGISGGSKYTGGNALNDTGGGGGAGYYGGGGGGYYNHGSGGGGGSSLTTNLTSLVVYNSPNRYSAPNTVSPYYQTGVGGGGSNGQSGGNGLIVIMY